MKVVRVSKMVKKIVSRVLGRVRIKKKFPETISQKMHESKSSFDMK